MQVEVALVNLSHANGAVATCEYVKDKRVDLKRKPTRKGKCSDLVWLTTKLQRGDRWTLRLSRALPAGHWTAYVRAFNAAGVFGEGKDGNLFTVSRGNERHFVIR